MIIKRKCNYIVDLTKHPHILGKAVKTTRTNTTHLGQKYCSKTGFSIARCNESVQRTGSPEQLKMLMFLWSFEPNFLHLRKKRYKTTIK